MNSIKPDRELRCTREALRVIQGWIGYDWQPIDESDKRFLGAATLWYAHNGDGSLTGAILSDLGLVTK